MSWNTNGVNSVIKMAYTPRSVVITPNATLNKFVVYMLFVDYLRDVWDAWRESSNNPTFCLLWKHKTPYDVGILYKHTASQKDRQVNSEFHSCLLEMDVYTVLVQFDDR